MRYSDQHHFFPFFHFFLVTGEFNDQELRVLMCHNKVLINVRNPVTSKYKELKYKEKAEALSRWLQSNTMAAADDIAKMLQEKKTWYTA